MFSQAPDGDGGNWAVDYPRADVNLSIRLSELTKTRVSTDASGEPDHVVIALTDPALFECPFVMMTEVGAAYISPEEAVKLASTCRRAASCGPTTSGARYAWEHWVQRAQQGAAAQRVQDLRAAEGSSALPAAVSDCEGAADRVDQPLVGSGGGTSERDEDSAVPHAMGIADRQGRLMVLMTHNTDFGDSWEREGDDPNYFYRFSVDGYAFGINVLLYAMSH